MLLGKSCPSRRKSPPSIRSACASCGGTSRTLATRRASLSTIAATRKASPARPCARSKWPRRLLKPGDLLYLISRWKNNSIRPDAGGRRSPQTDKEHLAASAYRRYQKALKAAGAVDFDDLLLLTEELFQRFPEVRAGGSQPLRSPAGRRIPGHQRHAISHRQSPGRGTPQLVRRGRRRPVDLRLARCRSHAHPATSNATGPRPRSSAWKTTIALPREIIALGQPADRLQ